MVRPAMEKAKKTNHSAVAIELPAGRIVTGRGSTLLNSTSSVLLNAIKELAGIDDEGLLIPPTGLTPSKTLKKEMLGSRYPVLRVEEVLIALAISAENNELAKKALRQVKNLRGCEAHSSDIISGADAATFRKRGLNVTC